MPLQPISRRTLLRSAAGAAIGLPMLDAMLPAPALISSASANVARTAVPAPVRLAFLYVPNGMHMPDWKPTGASEHDFQLGSIMKPVADLREQMTVVSGLALRGAEALGDGGGDHARAAAAFLTGAHPRKTHGSNIRNGQSVDQLAASIIGDATRLKSLELGTEESAPAGTCDTGYSCLYTSNISWRTPQSPLAKEIDPAAVFDRLFGVPGGGGESVERRQQRQRRTQSVLDHVRGEARRLSDQLGANDRRKLDEYLYGVREIEQAFGEI